MPRRKKMEYFGGYNNNDDTSNYREKTCPECGGSGYDPYDGGQCSRCNGLGVISYNADTGEEY